MRSNCYSVDTFCAIAGLSAVSAMPHAPACRYLPGDPQWPNHEQWQRLNESVAGHLVRGSPLAAACHGMGVNASACVSLQSRWTEAQLYPFIQNSSCTLGNIAPYAIDVASAQDVIAGLKFAETHNIRISVKNTGHDFLGRSAGAGSLGLWTHNLKDIEVFNYTSPAYSGPALKMGAGTQAFEAYQVAEEHGYRITGGFCPTVGLAGGYVQSGGHGALLGARTPPHRHPYHQQGALTKAHPDGIVAGDSLSFSPPNDGNNSTYWAAIEVWHDQLLAQDMTTKMTSYFGFTSTQFNLYAASLPDSPATVIETILRPFISILNQFGLPYTFEATEHRTFYDFFAFYTPGSLPYGSYSTNSIIGGQLIPQDTAHKNRPALLEAFRSITTSHPGVRINGVAGNVTHARVGNTAGANSVLPAWRGALYTLNMDISVDPASSARVLEGYQALMNQNQNLLKATTQGSAAESRGAYLNEATFDNPNWRVDYFGSNYPRLLDVKKAYDPSHLFHGPATVGSEYWRVAADGRLCATAR
ncbi:hypothetical protein BDV06DRAFT_234053 [Aspergillus oleicola]